MKKALSWLRHRVTYLLAYILIILVPAQALLKKGYVLSPDSHEYSRWASALLDFHFNFAQFVHHNPFKVSLWFYCGWINVVAVAKWCSLTYWASLLVAYNYLAFALMWLILCVITYRVFNRAFSVIVLLLLGFLSNDVGMWVHYILSDISFMLLVFVLFLLQLVWFGPGAKSSWWQWAVFFVILLAAVFYRPAGFALILSVLLCFLGRAWIVLRGERAHAAMGECWLMASGVLALVVCAYAYAISHAAHLPSAINHVFNTKEYVHYYQQGVVVMGRTSTYLPGDLSFWHCLQLIGLRIVYFFAAFASQFHSSHKIKNAIFFIILYGFVITAFIAFCRGQLNKHPKMAWCLTLSLHFRRHLGRADRLKFHRF